MLLLILRTVPIHVYDGFESQELSGWRWSRWRLIPRAVASESTVVRAGRHALAITVHDGDRYEAASDTGAATERDELMEPWWLFSRTGRTYVYSFSLYLAESVPRTPDRLVIAQWRQVCEDRRCSPDRPILALRIENGALVVSRNDEQGKHILYQGTKDVRQRWLDFRVEVRFDSTEGGFADICLDGHRIVRYQGPTVFQPQHGYPGHGLLYFKTGLYRDALQQPPWTIYVDEYRKDQCPGTGCQ